MGKQTTTVSSGKEKDSWGRRKRTNLLMKRHCMEKELIFVPLRKSQHQLVLATGLEL